MEKTNFSLSRNPSITNRFFVQDVSTFSLHDRILFSLNLYRSYECCSNFSLSALCIHLLHLDDAVSLKSETMSDSFLVAYNLSSVRFLETIVVSSVSSIMVGYSNNICETIAPLYFMGR